MSQTVETLPYRRQPIRRTLKALSRGLMWIDRMGSRPAVKPFALGFILTALILTTSAYIASPWYELVVNRSDSLPGLLFLLDKTRKPKKGDVTVIDMPEDSRFYAGWRLIKKVRGVEGDRITFNNHEVFINGLSAGIAMQKTSNGKYRLYPISEGDIPANKVFLSAPHNNSYDSRYASVGLRDYSELLGKMYPLF